MGQPMGRFRFDENRLPSEWRAVSDRLMRMARALTGKQDDAEDLAQQTLATLLAKRRERIDHLGFARRTMFRLWLDRQRSVRRRLARISKLAWSARLWHSEPDRLSDSERHRSLREAVLSLPPRQRAVLVLRLVEELDYEQIAETLSCSVETVRANLHVARRRVRETMGEPS